jgi:tetratricopeptide (TPR) repeat protein
MRNIEEVAAEEQIRVRRHHRRLFRKTANVAGVAMGVWGWFVFSQGEMGLGSVWIISSFAAFLAGWGAHRLHPFSSFAWSGAILSAGGALVIYGLTKAPSFYWGRDPDYYLAVQAGAVTQPLWSPLTYLIGQASLFVFNGDFFTLPMQATVLAAFCFCLMGLWWFTLVREKNTRSFVVVLLLAGAVLVSRPFWDAGTIASGSTALLGLLLFVWQRLSLGAGEVRGESLGLLTGLLWSVHPAWGILGLFNLFLADRLEVENPKRALLFFGLGLTPFLWVVFRTLQFFPSWGGEAPLGEWLAESKDLLARHFFLDWDWFHSFSFLGWALLPLLFSVVFLSAYRWKIAKVLSYGKDSLVWLMALILALLFASESSWQAGPTGLWVFAGLVELLIRAGDKHYDRRSTSGVPFSLWTLLLAGAAVVSGAAALLPGQAALRSDFLFPQQHALNLIRGLNPQGVLICQDPFEAAACRVARLSEPLTPGIVILDQQELNQKWYLSQVIGRDSGLLFSKINGSTESVLKDLILSNESGRELDWGVSQLPDNWDGPEAVPTLLTQRFGPAALSPESVEDVQARYDLTAVVQSKDAPSGPTAKYYHRYVEGFDTLGQWLLKQRQYSAAIRTYERALSLDPDDNVSKQSLALIYTQDNLLEAARMDFEKIVKTYPTRIKEVMGEMDRTKMKNGANDAVVLNLLNETIRLNRVLADAQYHLGQLYEKDGNEKAAQNLLEAAVRMNPQRLESQMALGLLMEKMGNREEAEEDLRGVLKIDPQNKQAQTELWKLLNKS